MAILKLEVSTLVYCEIVINYGIHIMLFNVGS